THRTPRRSASVDDPPATSPRSPAPDPPAPRAPRSPTRSTPGRSSLSKGAGAARTAFPRTVPLERNPLYLIAQVWNPSRLTVGRLGHPEGGHEQHGRPCHELDDVADERT